MVNQGVAKVAIDPVPSVEEVTPVATAVVTGVGVVGETTCDGKKKAYEIFGEMAPVHVMELPQMKREEDMVLWRSEIDRLIAKLEEVTGNKLTLENLKRAAAEVNGKRKALQRLNAARAASNLAIASAYCPS